MDLKDYKKESLCGNTDCAYCREIWLPYDLRGTNTTVYGCHYFIDTHRLRDCDNGIDCTKYMPLSEEEKVTYVKGAAQRARDIKNACNSVSAGISRGAAET